MEEKNGLIKQFNSSEGVVDYIKQLDEKKNFKAECRINSRRMQEDFIEPNEFLMDYLNSNFFKAVSTGDSATNNIK